MAQLLLHLQNELHTELGVCISDSASNHYFEVDFATNQKPFVGYRFLPTFVFVMSEKPSITHNHEVTDVVWYPIEKLHIPALDKYTRTVMFSDTFRALLKEVA